MQTRDRILAAAGDLFARKGYDGTSVRDITARAKANLGAVTYHFGGKEQLFGEVVSGRIGRMCERGREVAESGLAADAKLRELLMIYGRYLMHDDPGMRAMMTELMAGGRRLPRAAVEGIALRNALFAAVLEDGVREGVFRRCDVETAAWSFFGMLSAHILYQPLVRRHGRGGRFPLAYVERVVDGSMDLFLRGLMAKGQGAPRPAARAGGRRTRR